MSRSGAIGGTIVVAHVVVACLAFVLAPYSPTEIDSNAVFASPSRSHPFGTDQFGRDVLSRVMYGGQQAMIIAVAAVVLAVVVGGSVGALLGYVRGLVDEIAMRILDALLSIPALLAVLVTITGFGGGMLVVIGAMATMYSFGVIRVMRAAAMEIAPREFVTAARARGESIVAIVGREIAPNLIHVAAVEFAIRTSFALLLFSALSFLGFASDPPTPDWGLMIAENQGTISFASWVTVFPILALGSLVIGLNLAADGAATSLGLDRTRRCPM